MKFHIFWHVSVHVIVLGGSREGSNWSTKVSSADRSS